MLLTTLIDVPTLAARLGSASLVVVDCRFDLAAPAAGRTAYLHSRIPGAAYADLDVDLSARPDSRTGRHPLPAAADFARLLRRLGVGATTGLVAYDAGNGAFAARFWWLARWLGHSNIAVLDGGFAAWVAGGGAIETGPPVHVDARADTPPGAGDAAPAAPPGPTPGAAAWLSSDEVAAAIATGRALLVDARAPERYAGTFEPLDAHAGHVPSARNFPFLQNLAADGRFLAKDALRERWLSFLEGFPATSVIAMCGSGVTACHNLLALEHAGLRGAKLYAGSWSEWIRDPSRGVATGTEP
jgi:thiosulfate/3-mercaptopyruvate sulfurtransferase